MFEPNTPSTWKSLSLSVSSFLDQLYRKGMFAGGSPAESFYVKCDAETNSPDNVNEGTLMCEIGVAPAIPSEFIVVKVVASRPTSTVGHWL